MRVRPADLPAISIGSGVNLRGPTLMLALQAGRAALLAWLDDALAFGALDISGIDDYLPAASGIGEEGGGADFSSYSENSEKPRNGHLSARPFDSDSEE